MTEARPRVNPLLGALQALWRGVDFARRLTLNLLFLSLLAVGIALLFSGTPQVSSGSALVLAPEGALVDQLSRDPLRLDPLTLLSEGPAETQLRDLTDAVRLARDDQDIALLALDLRRLAGGGLSKFQELARAIAEFRASGKRVLAYSEYYTEGDYLLAVNADQIYLDPQGELGIQGFASYRHYYREALAKLDIEFNVFRVGEYKSAIEPFLRDDMSPEDRSATSDWLGDLWSAYRQDVTTARGVEPAAFDEFVEHYPERLRLAGGDSARAALEAGLVDEHLGWRELELRLQQELGESDDGAFRQIDVASYLAARRPRPAPGAEHVALVVASGEIVPQGRGIDGTASGEAVASLLERARLDERAKAVVFRVDSGGGSVFGSELIRRAVERLRRAGKPVVASLGSVAASGGYWIALPASEIWASPTTLTGSIGIFGGFPTFERSLDRLGVHTDGVTTGPLAAGLRLDLAVSEPQRDVLQQSVEHGYRDFVDRVASARGKTAAEIDAIARGRVWSGRDALDLGLVDRLGDLDAALARAAELGGLPKGAPVVAVERERGVADLIYDMIVGLERRSPAVKGRVPSWRELLGLDPRSLLALQDPRGLYAHCLCRAP